MITATFSTYAPMVTVIMTLLCATAPPKLRITKTTRHFLHSVLKELRKSRPLLVILIVQLSGMTYVAFAMMAINTSGFSWLSTVWDGLSYDVLIMISIVVLLLALTSVFLNAPKTFLLQVVLMTIWIRSFMVFRGFVWTGGDAGEHVAVAKYLLDGGSVPFLDPVIHESVSANWRYGSFATLFFNSNYAFSSFLTGFLLDMAASGLAVAFSSTTLIFGSYALSTSIFKSRKAQRICILLFLLNTVDFFWQFRSDPNAFTHSMYPAYLALVLLTPTTSFGLLALSLGSFLMWAIHPLSIVLLAPVFIYTLVAYLRRLGKRALLLALLLMSGGAIFFLFLTTQDLGLALVRTLSLQHIFYPRSGTSEGMTIGTFISESSLFSYYLAKYYAGQVIFVLSIAATFLVLLLRDRVSTFLRPNRRRFTAISVLTIILILSLDLFIDPTSLISVWRLWPLVLYLLLPSLTIAILAIAEIPFFTKIKIGSRKIRALAAGLPSYALLCVVLLNLTTTMTYNAGNSLNFDTLSVEEYGLLSSLVSTVNQSDTIILAEVPTFRYIIAIMSDWPPSTPTYYSRYQNLPALWYYQSGAERINAFVDLVYLGQAEDAIRIAVEENVSTIHIVVLNRLSGPKPGWWMKTAYVDIEGFGKRILENHAGHILQIRPSSVNAVLSNLSATPNEVQDELVGSR